MLSFLGGFSSATSMVIVATIALSTMVSNHIVMPLWLRRAIPGASLSGDVRQVVLMSRRLSDRGVLALGYVYYRLSGGGTALAAIGLISFAGVGAGAAGDARRAVLARRHPRRRGGRSGDRLSRLGSGRCSCPRSAPARSCRRGVGPWALRPRLAAAAGAVRDRGARPGGPCGDLVDDAQYGGLLPGLAPDLSDPAGAVAGRAVRQCVRSFAGGARLDPGRRRGRGPADHGAAHPGPTEAQALFRARPPPRARRAICPT